MVCSLVSGPKLAISCLLQYYMTADSEPKPRLRCCMYKYLLCHRLPSHLERIEARLYVVQHTSDLTNLYGYIV